MVCIAQYTQGGICQVYTQVVYARVYTPGYTISLPLPATVASRHARRSSLTALDGGVTELTVSDERVTVTHSLFSFIHPFHCWSGFHFLSDLPYNQVGWRHLGAKSSPSGYPIVAEGGEESVDRF